MMNRLNTKFMLDYKNCAPPDCDLSCVLCQSVAVEDLMHLFFLCPFPKLLESFRHYLGYYSSFGRNVYKGQIGLSVELFHGEIPLCCLAYLETKEWVHLQAKDPLFHHLEATLNG